MTKVPLQAFPLGVEQRWQDTAQDSCSSGNRNHEVPSQLPTHLLTSTEEAPSTRLRLGQSLPPKEHRNGSYSVKFPSLELHYPPGTLRPLINSNFLKKQDLSFLCLHACKTSASHCFFHGPLFLSGYFYSSLQFQSRDQLPLPHLVPLGNKNQTKPTKDPPI